MIPQISKSQRFKEDLQRYSKISESLTDLQVKNKFLGLVNQLVGYVKRLDSAHYEIQGGAFPQSIPDTRDKITEVRKQIEKIVKDTKI